MSISRAIPSRSRATACVWRAEAGGRKDLRLACPHNRGYGMTRPERIGDVSFWYADIGMPARARHCRATATRMSASSAQAYTGLWSSLLPEKADPGLKIIIVEKEFAGFGASGRNGGWLSGGFAWSQDKICRHPWRRRRPRDGRGDERNRRRGESVSPRPRESAADILPTDELMVATSPAQMQRVSEEVAHRRHWGEEGRVFEISRAEALARVNVPGTLGGMIVKGVARIQPAKLVRGLAEVVGRMGVTIAEGTEVTGIARPGHDPAGARSGQAPSCARPKGSPPRCQASARMAAPDFRPDRNGPAAARSLGQDRAGNGHEILGDFMNAYCYCQRTREGRITVGARGVPYRYGSSIDTSGRPGQRDDPPSDRDPAPPLPCRPRRAHCARLVRRPGRAARLVRDRGLRSCQPHRLGGGLCGGGASRHRTSQERTLADLTLGRTTDLTHLPWVNRRVRKWEPEPCAGWASPACMPFSTPPTGRRTARRAPPRNSLPSATGWRDARRLSPRQASSRRSACQGG